MKHILVVILGVLLFSGCSLLKFSINTGDTPLSPSDLNTRVVTRAFYSTFTSKVISAADSITESTSDIQIKLNATRWKLDATSAATQAVFQTVPEISLINTWVLCCQMEKYLRVAPDSVLFDAYTSIARQAAEELRQEIETLAKKVSPSHRYNSMETFVVAYCRDHSINSLKSASKNLSIDWLNYINSADDKLVSTVGTMSEVMTDMTERFSGYTQQFGNELSWSKRMIELRFEQDSINTQLMSQLDSLTTDFRRITLIMQHSPEMLNAISSDLNVQFETMINTLNRSINGAFINFDTQREQLQGFISAERETILKEAAQAAQDSIDKAMAGLPTLIGKILTYFVLAILVLFSLPFILGYIIGKSRGRSKDKKDKKSKKDKSENKE